jgi:hypothetical protein
VVAGGAGSTAMVAGGGGAKRRLRRRTGAVRVQTLTVTLYRPPASEWDDWASPGPRAWLAGRLGRTVAGRPARPHRVATRPAGPLAAGPQLFFSSFTFSFQQFSIIN